MSLLVDLESDAPLGQAEEGLADHFRPMLELLGEDPTREGLLKTPARFAKSMRFLTAGYQVQLNDVVNGALFHEDVHEPVVVQNIEFYSLCEHHVLPFFGMVHAAYLPDGKIIGLSKIPRIVEMFSRRLQVQERLTQQIADALHEVLSPRGVAVQIEAQHLCMMMRGVQKRQSLTTTAAVTGIYASDNAAKRDILQNLRPV